MYSDLTIVCGSDTYNVHKAIICPQSSFFRVACQPGRFQEGTTNVINITASSGRNKPVGQVKPVEAIEPVEPAKPTEPTEPTESDVVPEFDWDLDVETTTSVKLMIHYFYPHDYLERETTQTDGVTVHEVLLDEHARMYAMGEKYGILGLKTVALTKFCGERTRLVTEERVVTATVIAVQRGAIVRQDLTTSCAEISGFWASFLRGQHGNSEDDIEYARGVVWLVPPVTQL